MLRLVDCLQTAPSVYDFERAEESFGALCEVCAQDSSLAELHGLLATSDELRALLRAIFGASVHLSGLVKRDPWMLQAQLLAPPDLTLAAPRAALAAEMAEAGAMGDAMRALRRFKQHVALLSGLADLGGVWTVMEAAEALTTCADAALQEGIAFLLGAAAARGDYIPPDPDRPAIGSGYIIVGMGKYGARELNYSSDIDLIVFYDPEITPLKAGIEAGSFFVRLTRDLVTLMQERTADGYVFRTDLRLRPDPGATQLALSTGGALQYYESFGQNWERAALIKARVVAGDLEAGASFLRLLQPFVWRKYLDFAAIADVHAMKRQIHATRGFGRIAIAGHNIKLGRGGIREIEFFVQTQQLIAGGRQNELRAARTLDALALLTRNGWIEETACRELEAAYLFLRSIEHRLQMLADEQTHKLPDRPQDLERLARFAGFSDAATFSAALQGHMERVEAHYAALFEDVPSLASDIGNLVFTGDADDPETLKTLARMGFENPPAVTETVRGWHFGRYRAMRSKRAQERLTEIMPALLEALSTAAQPGAALAAFDRFLKDLPAGVQLFSLLRSNPSLLQLLTTILGTAPRLAHVLSRRARLLDAVLDPGFLAGADGEPSFDRAVKDALAGAPDHQTLLDLARVFGQEQAFLIGVRLLIGAQSADLVGDRYAQLAGALIRAMHEAASQELAAAHGSMAGAHSAVLAMGKLGGRELTAASDIDLVMVYDFDEECPMSDGAKPLQGGVYFTRLTQRLISALSAQTGEGRLYEVDMRLRPSGSAGPVATRLSGFVDYYETHAWVWEHMALTRARVVSGPAPFRKAIDEAIRTILCWRRDRAETAAAVIEMRERIEAEKGTDDVWHLKQARGGLVDLEFITQFLQLVSAHDRPEVLSPNTAESLRRLADAGLLASSDAEVLIPAAELYQNLTQLIRLCLEPPLDPRTAPDAMKALIAAAAEQPDFARAEVQLSATLERVHDAFGRLIR